LLLRVLLFLFISGIYAESKIKLESVDSDRFPLIHLYITENKLKLIQSENIHISETKDGVTKQVYSLSILKLNQIRPIKLILAIHASEDNQKLDYLKQIAILLVQSLSKDDKVGLQVFGNDTYFLNLNLSKSEALAKIETISNSKGNRIVSSLNFLLTQARENDMPSICFVLASNIPSKQDDKVATLVDKSRSLQLPLNFFSTEDEKFLAISEYTGGDFFPSDKNKSVTEIQSKLYEFRKTLPILEYKSPFSEINAPLKKQNIDIQLRVGSTEIKSKYELNLISYLKSRFNNLEFFYTFMFVILFFCLILLFAINAQIRKKTLEEEARLREEELMRNDLYYHENSIHEDETISTFENYSTREETFDDSENYNYSPSVTNTMSAILQVDELAKAESYNSGVLILKVGPNPGRQFTINKDEITIGNSASNDLILIDSSVSPMHAKIKKSKNVYILFDTVSKSGVILNGVKLLRPKPLFDFDEIKIGKVVMLFRGK
jgi:hypothetical protein